MSNENNTQDETRDSVLSAYERENLRQGLSELSDTMPPRMVWQRIKEQARAEGLLVEPGLKHRVKWLAVAGIAAAVVLAALRMPEMLNPDSGGQIAGTHKLNPIPEFSEQSTPSNGESLNTLMVQSQQLEHNLRAIPYQSRLMRAGTAATVLNLEDQIAVIDYQLNHSAMRMNRVQTQNYWRERVRLMDSLVQLRYAQAQRASF
jgi:hypothetical protein